MYTVNDTHPEVGVAAKYLKKGEHDTNDYEDSGNKYWQKSSGRTTTGYTT